MLSILTNTKASTYNEENYGVPMFSSYLHRSEMPQRILEVFSATLRNEVDLDQLSERLMAVVRETMQPTHISLWIRKHKPREESY